MTVAAYDKKKRCPVCRKEFFAARQTATYCTPTCRQRAHRKPALESRIKELYDDAHLGIMGLIALTDRAGGLDALRAQKRLQAIVLEIIQSADDDTRSVIYEQLKDDFYRLRDNSVSRYRPEKRLVNIIRLYQCAVRKCAI